MAKGNGAQAALAELIRRQDQNIDVPQCPLCGNPMHFNGEEFFCYAGTNGARGQKCPRLPVICEAIKAVIAEDPSQLIDTLGRFPDDCQGQTLAAIVGEEDEIIATLETTRGGGGCTNIVLYPAYWYRKHLEARGIYNIGGALQDAIAKYGWIYADWVRDKVLSENNGDEQCQEP